MADVISFNKARKRKSREDKARSAQENRVRHGRSKAEKRREHAEAATEARRLDGHRRASPDNAPEAEAGGDPEPPSHPRSDRTRDAAKARGANHQQNTPTESAAPPAPEDCEPEGHHR